MSIYLTCYDLINEFIFGGEVLLGTYTDLVCILLSSIACIFCFSLPFIIVWRAIKLFI